MTDIVTPPTIDALPPAPQPADTPSEFDSKAFALLAAQVAMVGDFNSAAAATQQNATAANERAVAAASSASAANGSANTASIQAGIASGAATTATDKAAEATASALSASKLNLGNKASPPTTDNQGAALLTGALYWDTALPGMRSWNGGAWVTLPAATAAAISYLPFGLGAVATTVQSKLREFVSVKDFGAVGDGVADDTAALDAAARVVAIGGVLRIPAGTYKRTGPWNIAGNNFTIEGDGDATCIFDADTTTDNTVTLNCTGDNITVRNLRIDGRMSALSGSVLRRAGLRVNGNYPHLQNVTVHDTLTNGMSAGHGRGVRIEGCVARDIGYFGGHQDALGIVATVATQVSITGCTAYNTARTGIFVYLSENIAVAGNTVDSCENGIRVDVAGDHHAAISGNTVMRGTGDGIRFTGKYVTVTGNHCHGNGGSGATSSGGDFQAICGNVLTGNTQHGIRVGEEQGATSHLTISGNVATGNTGCGLYITTPTKGATDVVVTGNDFTGNTDRSMRLANANAASTMFHNANHFPASPSPVLTATNWAVSTPGTYLGSLAAAATITPVGAGTHGVSGTADITNITALPGGTQIVLFFVANAAGSGLVDGTGNLRLAGNFAYTANSTIMLVATNGNTWAEVSRSLN